MPKRKRHDIAAIMTVTALTNANAHRDLSHSLDRFVPALSTHTYQSPVCLDNIAPNGVHAAIADRRADKFADRPIRRDAVEHHINDTPPSTGAYAPTAPDTYYTPDPKVRAPKRKPERWHLLIGNTYRGTDGSTVRLTRYDGDTREYGYITLGDPNGTLHIADAKTFRKAFTPEAPVYNSTMRRS